MPALNACTHSQQCGGWMLWRRYRLVEPGKEAFALGPTIGSHSSTLYTGIPIFYIFFVRSKSRKWIQCTDIYMPLSWNRIMYATTTNKRYIFLKWSNGPKKKRNLFKTRRTTPNHALLLRVSSTRSYRARSPPPPRKGVVSIVEEKLEDRSSLQSISRLRPSSKC